MFSLLLPLAAYAQSASMMKMAEAELQKRGLSETEVRTRLAEKGIDVDAIQPADYAKYQSQVTAVLDELQAEKQAAAEGAAANAASAAATDIPESTIQEIREEAKAEERVEEVAVKVGGDDIYGHSLFLEKSLEKFRTSDGAAAPETYVLGEGDEIHISIFGASQTEIQQRVAPDGSIQPTGASKIFLKGLTLAQARDLIRNRMAAFYSFRPDEIAVTIVAARTVMVNIYGEVALPGGYTISALNSAFNALAAAGGPMPGGSVRDIQVVRGKQRYSLDVYSFMEKPEMQARMDLQNNDIIYVPLAKTVVTLEGGVKRPMKYELKDKEDLRDLIKYAGGLRPDVYPNYVQVERYQNGVPGLLEFDLAKVMNGSQKVAMADGDIVRIRTVNEPMETYVSIEGGVYYPGRYDLANNSSLIKLLESAKPTYTAKTDFLFVERTRPDETTEYLTVPFPGVDGNPDFTLVGRDVVRVLEQATYRDIETISVDGQVRQPFTKNFALNDRMTVAQAIEYAGGLKENVYPTAYIFRKDLKTPGKMQYIRVELDAAADVELQPGDQLNIYDNSTYNIAAGLSIVGAVNNPVSITFEESLTIHDLITMAGGFSLGAAYDRVEVFRAKVSRKDQVAFEQITIEVDSDYNCVDPYFQLQPFDQVVVRQTPNFSKGRMVELNGRVRYPGQYVLEDYQVTLSEVVEMAGGLLDDSDPYGVQLFRTYKGRGNITFDMDEAMRHKGNLAKDPILFEGDVININRRENTVRIMPNATRMYQYIAEDYRQDTIDVENSRLIVYQGPKSAAWYIRHYAGGFVKEADRNSVTVTMLNNQMESTTRFLGIRHYPKVESGSTIALVLDPRKVEKSQREEKKIDWDAMYAKTLTTLTTIATLIAVITAL